ncbi:MAG: biotin--[acetyl-CoA-carboxylase] ligase [Lachnospiraceae bacterium]|nr:biotin--[acetyl-CoA-carboxylase] ligase [Lachnospiraceae bacterium]
MRKSGTKEKILALLNERKGTSYSGQELADTLNISRTSVWKAINALRDEGVKIGGSTNSGYTLAPESDVLNSYVVEDLLNEDSRSFYRINCVKTIDSTNLKCKSEAESGAYEGVTYIAEEQTKGRGRRGRSFFSPDSTGLYLSILLRPELEISDAVLITTAAAVAAATASEKVNDLIKEGDVKIKWVNDLYLNDKKISGILTEAGLSMETGGFDYAVMGIGFNLAPPKGGWPDDIKDRAGSLFEEGLCPAGTRNRLAAEFLNAFLPIYKALPDVTYLSEYRKRQLTLDKDIDVIDGAGNKKRAHATGIDDRCGLIVIFEGEDKPVTLTSGEISTRVI